MAELSIVSAPLQSRVMWSAFCEGKCCACSDGHSTSGPRAFVSPHVPHTPLDVLAPCDRESHGLPSCVAASLSCLSDLHCILLEQFVWLLWTSLHSPRPAVTSWLLTLFPEGQELWSLSGALNSVPAEVFDRVTHSTVLTRSCQTVCCQGPAMVTCGGIEAVRLLAVCASLPCPPSYP